jgi:predicted dehydrogenase
MMRIGIVGLQCLYYPTAFSDALSASPNADFAGAATLGASEGAIREVLGMGPREYADRYGIGIYDQPEEMVVQEDLDAVVIATRHTDHALWAERMAQIGVDIYICKPFATTLDDAERIVQCAGQYGVRIAVGPSQRHLPALQAVREALDQDLIGAPFAARICHHHGTIDAFSPRDWYRSPEQGGPELSLAWHVIDIALYLMKGTVERVFADYGNFTSPDSPFMDCGWMALHMDGGRLASIDMYFCNRLPYPSWQAEIIGPEGVLSIQRLENDARGTAVVLDTADCHRTLPLPRGGQPGPSLAWIDDFREGREPTVSAEVARTITRISLAARKSAASGVPVAP